MLRATETARRLGGHAEGAHGAGAGEPVGVGGEDEAVQLPLQRLPAAAESRSHERTPGRGRAAGGDGWGSEWRAAA